MTSLNLSHQWLYFTSLHLIIYYYQPEHLVNKHYFNFFIFYILYKIFSIFLCFKLLHEINK